MNQTVIRVCRRILCRLQSKHGPRDAAIELWKSRRLWDEGGPSEDTGKTGGHSDIGWSTSTVYGSSTSPSTVLHRIRLSRDSQWHPCGGRWPLATMIMLGATIAEFSYISPPGTTPLILHAVCSSSRPHLLSPPARPFSHCKARHEPNSTSRPRNHPVLHIRSPHPHFCHHAIRPEVWRSRRRQVREASRQPNLYSQLSFHDGETAAMFHSHLESRDLLRIHRALLVLNTLLSAVD